MEGHDLAKHKTLPKTKFWFIKNLNFFLVDILVHQDPGICAYLVWDNESSFLYICL